jgi:hypothetical protein
MNIYCVAKFDGGKSLFKLIRRDNMYWVWECRVPSIWYLDLKNRNTFFRSDRTFDKTPNGYHPFEEGDLGRIEG